MATKKLLRRGRLVKKHRVKGTTAGKGTAAVELPVKGTAAVEVPDDSTQYWYSKKHLDRSAEYAP